jgi:hypothetical protein
MINVVYTGVVKSLKKIIMGSVIAVLAFFTSLFCVSPMTALAMEKSSLTSSMDGDMTTSAPVAAWNSCVFNCFNKASQAVNVKKFSVDSNVNILAAISYHQTFNSNSLVFSSGVIDFFGTPPPVPDILSSVFKKE